MMMMAEPSDPAEWRKGAAGANDPASWLLWWWWCCCDVDVVALAEVYVAKVKFRVRG